MKKVLALVLAVVMCVGMASVAFGITVEKKFDAVQYMTKNGDIIDTGDLDMLKEDVLEYVAGERFYILPVIEDGNGGNALEGSANAPAAAKITDVTVTRGSTTVTRPAFFYDNKGNQPSYRWAIVLNTEDIAAVKSYDVKLEIEAEYGADTYKSVITLVVQDTMQIEANDIKLARYDDNKVDTMGADGYIYVVSADAFKEIKKGETFTFSYDGYDIKAGAGINCALNFRASIEKIDAVVEKYGEDKVLGLINFAYKSTLPQEVTVVMECTEYSSVTNHEKAYVYRIEGDKLVLVTDAGVYEAAHDTVTFKTNKLGTLLATSQPIEGAVTSTDKANPGTGTNDVIGLAVAGVVIAAAAGFVALKK